MGRCSSFEGESAPFVMYSHTRACSIARKVGRKSKSVKPEDIVPAMHEMLRCMANYPDKLSIAVNENKPHIFALYMLELATAYNSFYRDCHVIIEGEVDEFNYAVSEKARELLRLGCKELASFLWNRCECIFWSSARRFNFGTNNPQLAQCIFDVLCLFQKSSWWPTKSIFPGSRVDSSIHASHKLPVHIAEYVSKSIQNVLRLQTGQSLQCMLVRTVMPFSPTWSTSQITKSERVKDIR